MLKERYRYVLSDMRHVDCNAYKYLNNQIVICLVYFCIMIENAVPAEKGFREIFALREIMTGRRLNFKHLQAAFREYIVASVDAEVTNDMNGRTQYFISIGPSENWQVSQVCFDLETGKVVFRRIITQWPMPTSIIQVINNWGKVQIFFCLI